MSFLGFLGLFLATSGHLKMSWAMSGYLSLYHAIFGYIWLSLANSGHIWLSLANSGYPLQYQACYTDQVSGSYYCHTQPNLLELNFGWVPTCKSQLASWAKEWYYYHQELPGRLINHLNVWGPVFQLLLIRLDSKSKVFCVSLSPAIFCVSLSPPIRILCIVTPPLDLNFLGGKILFGPNLF